MAYSPTKQLAGDDEELPQLERTSMDSSTWTAELLPTLTEEGEEEATAAIEYVEITESFQDSYELGEFLGSGGFAEV